MKRIASLAAAALAAGCVSSSTPPVYGANVTVYPMFQHYDWTGTFQNLTCAQAGVDSMVVNFSDSSSYPYNYCTEAGLQFGGFAPGSYWVQVIGYRNGVAAPLYDSGGVPFVVGNVDLAVPADAQGIPGNLTLDPALFNTGVQYPSPACSNALVDQVSYVVKDGAGVILAQGTVACTTDPPIITFSGLSAIDKDTLGIRMQALRSGVVVMDSCTMSFNHFGASDTALVDILYPIPSPCL